MIILQGNPDEEIVWFFPDCQACFATKAFYMVESRHPGCYVRLCPLGAVAQNCARLGTMLAQAQDSEMEACFMDRARFALGGERRQYR